MSLSKFIKNKKENITIANVKVKGDIIELNEKLLLHEYEEGLQIADSCGIPMLCDHFSWKRGFQNAFIGYPNDGKTFCTLFLMVVMSLQKKWKWVIWSPEMKSGSFVNGAVQVHYNDMINEIIWMLDGRTPYKHLSEKYGWERMPLKDYVSHIPWVKEHFITIDPKNRKPENIKALLMSIYEKQGFDGVLIDPFKNIEHDIRMRDDIYMEQLFADFKELAVETNASMNWIAHPKAGVQRVDKDGNLKPCDQYMLNGGAAWNNSMDGIYSVFRPDLLTDIQSPNVHFLNLKQRKQDLTTPRGAVVGIKYDKKRHRYLFNDYDPISGGNANPF